MPGLNPARADIVVAGAAILETVMDELGAPAAHGARRLRPARRPGAWTTSRGSDARSGRRLGARAQRAAPRARHRAATTSTAATWRALATELFDSRREPPACTSSATRARELLGYAALLHDIGGLLSYTDHQRHTYYLIRNADLLGFDQEEIAVMAATAFFHRKSLPRARHEVRRPRPGRPPQSVRRLSLFLRLAEILDRGHAALSRMPPSRVEQRGTSC